MLFVDNRHVVLDGGTAHLVATATPHSPAQIITGPFAAELDGFEYQPVDLKHFSAGKAPQLDLYQEVRGQKVLYCPANSIFSFEARRHLLDRTIDRLYIRFSAGQVSGAGGRLADLLSLPDELLSREVKSKILYSSAVSTARLVFMTPHTPESIKSAMGIVSTITDHLANLPDSFSAMINVTRDATVYAHSVNVCVYATALGSVLGYSKTDMVDLSLAALLHDVGKACVPDSILNKPGPLTGVEWGILTKHPEWGVELLGPEADRIPAAAAIIYQHHERIDGSGYPNGIRGEMVSRPVRLISLVDCYDALTSDRPYREGLPPFAALRTIKVEMSKLFDPDLFAALVKLLGRGAAAATPITVQSRALAA